MDKDRRVVGCITVAEHPDAPGPNAQQIECTDCKTKIWTGPMTQKLSQDWKRFCMSCLHKRTEGENVLFLRVPEMQESVTVTCPGCARRTRGQLPKPGELGMCDGCGTVFEMVESKLVIMSDDRVCEWGKQHPAEFLEIVLIRDMIGRRQQHQAAQKANWN